MNFAEMMAQVEAQGDRLDKERAKRDDESAAIVGPLLLGTTNDYVKVPKGDPSLPGIVVLRRPSAGEIKRLRHVMWEDSKKAGAIDAKAKAGIELARQCRVYPEAEQYDALVEAYPQVADECGKKAYSMAGAGADADAKS